MKLAIAALLAGSAAAFTSSPAPKSSVALHETKVRSNTVHRPTWTGLCELEANFASWIFEQVMIEGDLMPLENGLHGNY